jgi:hypothetical protein
MQTRRRSSVPLSESLKPYFKLQPMTVGSLADGGENTDRNANVLKVQNTLDGKRIYSHHVFIF